MHTVSCYCCTRAGQNAVPRAQHSRAPFGANSSSLPFLSLYHAMEHETIPAYRPAGASLGGVGGRPSPFTQDASSPPKTLGDGEQFSFHLKKPAALRVRFKQGKGSSE